MDFKIWECAVYLIDRVLAKRTLHKSFFSLMTATCLMISFKVIFSKTKFEGQEPQMRDQDIIYFGIDQINHMLGSVYQEDVIRQMEVYIMKSINWQIRLATTTEISYYLVKKFWMDSLKRNESQFPAVALIDSIQNFTKASLLIEECLDGNYFELALSVVISTFEISQCLERIQFVFWIDSLIKSVPWVNYFNSV